MVVKINVNNVHNISHKDHINMAAAIQIIKIIIIRIAGIIIEVGVFRVAGIKVC